ncbi:hypothetical protein N234_06705 [Ralstonia pickettii DTP0602]|nr:hypothetical protein N234_06705 [Ralstonia pickettii DTP0602]
MSHDYSIPENWDRIYILDDSGNPVRVFDFGVKVDWEVSVGKQYALRDELPEYGVVVRTYFSCWASMHDDKPPTLIEMTPDLQATLDSAKVGKVKAIGPVICTQSGGGFTYSGAQTAWKRACQRARQRYEKACTDSGSTPDPHHLVGMHFHDLRAKALTDLRRQSGAAAAQALAGHTTAKMTAHYTKPRDIERVAPVRKTLC